MNVRVCLVLVGLVACRDGRGTPPAVVVAVPVASVAIVDAGPLPIASVDPSRGDATFDFVRTPPTTVRALLTGLGIPADSMWESTEKSGYGSAHAPKAGTDKLSPTILSLSIEYSFDRYHQAPRGSARELASAQLERFTIRFAGRRDACAAALKRWGSSTTKPSPTGSVEQYGAFFLGAAESDGSFLAEWFEQEPDWAKPKIDAATRTKALEALAAAVTRAGTDAQLATATASRPDAGIRNKGSLNPHDQWIELEPPMAAIEFAVAIGHPGLIGRSVGVHMSEWQLEKITSGTAWTDPKLGLWTVEASLDARPTGASLGRPGAVALYALGPHDVVRRVRLFPTHP